MKPAAAAAVTLLTGHPAQRWLLGIAGALAAFAVVLKLFGAAGAPFVGSFAVFALLFTVLFVGELFHRLSALRTSSLVPHYRRHLLFGVAVTVAASTLAVAAALELSPRAGSVDVAEAASYLAFMLTAFTLLSCLISAQAAMLLIVLTGALMLDASIVKALSGSAPVGVPAGAILLTLAAWLVFARWYLRGEPMPQLRIPFVRPNKRARAKSNAAATSTAPATPHAVQSAAERTAGEFTLLFGMPLGDSVRMNLGIAAAAGLFFLGVLWVTGVDGTRVLGQLAIVPVVSVVVTNRALANALARRLWLLGGSRTALFRLADAAVWRRVVPLWAGSLLVTCVGMAWQGTLSYEMAIVAPLLFLAHGSIALYVILTPSGATKVVGGIALGVSCLLVFIVLSLSEPRTTASVVIALQLIIAIVLRALAERRWRTIDWIGARVTTTGRQRPRSEQPATRVTASTE